MEICRIRLLQEQGIEVIGEFMEIKNATTYLKEKYPNDNVRLIGSGWTSYAFEVGNKIIRIPKTNIKPYEKEAAILKFLQNKLPVEIPNPSIIKGTYPYAEHEKITGFSWNMQTYNNLPDDKKDLFAKDIAHFFAMLHSIPTSEIYKSIPKKLITIYKLDSLNNFYQYLKSYFSDYDIKRVYTWAKKIEQISDNPVLIHNDFWEANVLVDENHRLKGVFDWANSCLSNPEWDFKSLYHPNCFPLLDNILKFYHQETGHYINKDKIRKEKIADCMFNVQYFGKNPHLKIMMPNQWEETLNSVKKALNEIQFEENLILHKTTYIK